MTPLFETERHIEWGAWTAVGLFTVFLAINIAAGIVLVIAYGIFNPDTFKLVGEPDLPGWLIAGITAFGQIGTLIFIIMLLGGYYGLGFYEGIRWRGKKSNIKQALAAGLILGVLNAFLGPLIVPPDVEKIPLYQMVNTWLDLAVFSFLGIAISPIVEECLFRGIMQPAFSKNMRPPFAIVLTSIFFAAPHVYQLGEYIFGVFQVALLSILAGIFRERSGGVRDAFYCHLSYNAALFFLEIISRILGLQTM